MPVWPGDPPLRIRRVLSIEAGDGVNVSEIQTTAHVGTHIDAPLHCADGAASVERIGLDVLCGETVVVAAAGAGRVAPECFAGLTLHGKRVLFKTRNSGAGEAFRSDYAALTAEAATALVAGGAVLVGVDGPSVDPYECELLTAHRTLLGAGVVVLEGLDLSAVGPGAYEMVALPLAIRGADGSPARVVVRKL
jgi:arylformamidase